jgi:hypothetical protein
MRDGILLCRGKGNEEWNWLCAHGYGRIMSRSVARRRINLKQFQGVARDGPATLTVLHHAPFYTIEVPCFTGVSRQRISVVKTYRGWLGRRGSRGVL